MNATKDFWKHVDNGRVYAIECTTFGGIVGACGPFAPDNLPDLEDCKFDREILIWIETTMSEGKLRRFNTETVKP